MTNPTAKSPESTRSYCPHLGLSTDRTIMLAGSTLAHRCFAQYQPFAPDTGHQENFCLTQLHVKCPYFTTPVAPEMTMLVPVPPAQPNPNWAQVNNFGKANPFQRKGGLRGLLPQMTMVTVGIALFLAILTLIPDLLHVNRPSNAAAPTNPITTTNSISDTVLPPDTPTLLPIAVTIEAITPNLVLTNNIGVAEPITVVTAPEATTNLLPTPTPTDPVDAHFETPTPEAGGAVFYISPGDGDAGWWSSGDSRRSHLNDSFLYAGLQQGETYISALRFNLDSVPRGAKINHAQLRLTGLRQDRFVQTAKAVWLVELMPEKSLTSLGGADFLTMYSAPSSITLPPLASSDLAKGVVNSWDLDETMRNWLEQQLLDGAKSVLVRIKAATDNNETLFAWDSGLGPESEGNAAGLLLSLGPPPPTPPPLPTKPFIVATPTPIPANVLTVVAQAETATAVALTTGTYTPLPFDYMTPTPYPENLETVQAVALIKNLPAVVLETPTPANDAEATANAMFATAVAKTTGTFTPVPTAYVTPMLVLPSPPALNQGTEVARVLEATAIAQSGSPTNTPLPYNAVVAKYTLATPTAANVATVSAMQLVESVYGTPTPLPWGMIVITPIPPPIVPTATPLPAFLSVEKFTPTPDAGPPTAVPDVLPDFVHGKILFQTTRYGAQEVYAFDPATNQLYKVNEAWVYPLAQKQVAFSVDGKQEAFVGPDQNRILQIHTRSYEYNKERQITAFSAGQPGENNTAAGDKGPMSYDPAWDPAGEWIAFVSTNPGNDEIFVVNLDGSVLKQLTFNTFEWDKHPTWAPDGSRIVFFSNRESGKRRLWIMSADGSNQQNLSNTMPPPGNSEYEDWDPIWVR